MKEEVLYRYIKGQTTAEEDLQIVAWMEENPTAHQHVLDQVHFLYQMAELHGDESVPVARPRGRNLSLKHLATYALRIAAVVALVLVGGYVARQSTYNSISNQINRVQVPYGQRINITLADGSRVWLNAGAKLEYPVVFKKNARKVILSGEALFEVQHDSECPFYVETFATTIQVLGTKFNVNADEANDRFSTTLLQGEVLVTNLLNPRQDKIKMKPNDVVNLANGQLYVETMKDAESLCWTQGLVNISGLSFNELMSKFEQVFDVKILVTRKTSPALGAISGKIRVNDGIENALHILQYAADFTYERNVETNVVTIQ
ncbi:MAG: FecR domain-containing protein [Alistipes sp.]